MKRKYAPDHGANVDGKHHIVVLGCETANQVLAVEVGKQIDNFLKQKDYFVVGWELAFSHVSQVLNDFFDFSLEAFQGLNLLEDAAFQGIERDFLDFSEQVLNSDFFRLSGLYFRFDVEETLEN